MPATSNDSARSRNGGRLTILRNRIRSLHVCLKHLAIGVGTRGYRPLTPFRKVLKGDSSRLRHVLNSLVRCSSAIRNDWRVCYPNGPQLSWKLSPGPIRLGQRTVTGQVGQARIAIAATLRNSVSVAPLAAWTASPFRTVAT